MFTYLAFSLREQEEKQEQLVFLVEMVIVAHLDLLELLDPRVHKLVSFIHFSLALSFLCFREKEEREENKDLQVQMVIKDLKGHLVILELMAVLSVRSHLLCLHTCTLYQGPQGPPGPPGASGTDGNPVSNHTCMHALDTLLCVSCIRYHDYFTLF